MTLAGRTSFLGLAIVVVVLTACLPKSTNSFAPVSILSCHRPTGWVPTILTPQRTSHRRLLQRLARKKIDSSLWARIYGPSGDVEEEEENENTNSLFSTSSSSSENKNSALMDFLSHDRITALARLAVAFAPPGHALDLRDVEHVQVLRVDENHIDIQAVVCEQDGCVTLQVPVTFPHPCFAGDELQECIMGNLGELEVQAETFLRTIEWKESNYEEVEAEQREWQVLLATDDLHLPVWWVHPETREMSAECQSVRNLLNEEGFLAEIRALTEMALTESDAVISTDDGHADTSNWTVEQAAVAAVGPAGLLIRAATQRFELFEEAENRRIVEVPVSFGATANNVSDLRAAVLGAVAAAGDFVA
jgi:hypothetical protein